MRRPDVDLFPWLAPNESDQTTYDAIDSQNIARYKADALKDGIARGFSIINEQIKFVSAVPDLPVARMESFYRDLKNVSTSPQAEADLAKFKRQTINTSFAFSNDHGMNESVKALHTMPAKKLPEDKLRVAMVVGQGNFESMLPELLNHAHMVLFVDIDKNVLEHNLFMARILHSNADFQETYLDKSKNPLLLNRVKQGPVTAYQPDTKQQLAHYESTEYTEDYLAATLFNKGAITFAPFSNLSSKLRMYIHGHKKPQGGPLFEKNDLKEFAKLEAIMRADAEYAELIPHFKNLCKGIEALINKKGKPLTVNEAEHLKMIIDPLIDNRYFIAKDQRFEICRAASHELQFASVQLNLFDADQVAKLKAVFDANNVVVTFANVTNLFYYDNEKPFLPTARAEQPWGSKGNLVNSLKVLCDPTNTIYFYSIYETPGVQLLSSQSCQGLVNYVGAMTRNLKALNEKMVGTRTLAKIRDTQHPRAEQPVKNESSNANSNVHSQSK